MSAPRVSQLQDTSPRKFAIPSGPGKSPKFAPVMAWKYAAVYINVNDSYRSWFSNV